MSERKSVNNGSDEKSVGSKINFTVNKVTTSLTSETNHHGSFDFCWVPASNGKTPPNAIVGGADGEELYIARAHHEGSLTPGKLVKSQGVCYVAWGGVEHRKKTYEVFCSTGDGDVISGYFEPASGKRIPPNAIPGGRSENGEVLFIGRVWYNDSLTLGKVQPSHGVCYISYRGQELGFVDYEIYVAMIRNIPAATVCWIPAANGAIPPNAKVRGADDEDLYIARAHHEGALIPGKLAPSQRVCFMCWGGAEHRKSNYEVLCNDLGRFVPAAVALREIPSNALRAGRDEHGEPLFIGRVSYEGTLTLGKVQLSHGVCYIPYEGKEIGFEEFEIYVSSKA